MALTAGIVGLPNVGKSTLFNAITESAVEAANYPFATIQPNVGVVEVPDERMIQICALVDPDKVVPTTFEFTDIAGLVRGASKGEGLGNQFLSHIREVDAICHVVRCFEDSDIVHVEGQVDPIRDIETINLELIFADLDMVEKRMTKVQKKATTTKDAQAKLEYELLKKWHDALINDKPVRTVEVESQYVEIAKQFNLLTAKKMLYVANVNEDEIADVENNVLYQKVKEFAAQENTIVIPICAKLESEIALLEKEERSFFLEELGIESSGLEKLIKATYDMLSLKTYFTAGKTEVRAWTFIEGMSAPECAGIIHTDFQRGFIKAETLHYDDLITYQSEQKAKEAGKVRMEGKSYIVKDGDILHFRFNV